MNKEYKKIPDFKTEDEEREFWSTHDSTEYIDWSKAIKAGPFPNLKRTEGLIELRVSDPVMKNLKSLAKENDISELVQRYVAEGIKRDTAGLQ
ncbi:MAG: BrnA antitoxin family protein, partial [Candidatus Kapaibacterium sp.]